MIDISKFPDQIKLEITKADLIAFAKKLTEGSDSSFSLPTDHSEILTIDEVSSLLSLARQTVYGLCNKRAIPYYKKSKRLYFKRSELMAWLEEGQKKTQREFDEELTKQLSKNKKS